MQNSSESLNLHNPKPELLNRRHFLKTAGLGSITLATLPETAEAGSFLVIKGGEVKESRRSDGSTEYKHSDPETTHILEMISGYGQLTDRDRYAILRAWFVDRALGEKEKKYLGKTLEQWERASDQEILKAHFKQLYIKDELFDNIFIKYPSLCVNLLIPWKQQKPHKEIYDAVWELEKRLKNPRINWGVKPNAGSGIISRITSILGTGLIELQGAWYAPGSNTLFITSLDFTSWEWLGLDNLEEGKKYANPEEQKRIDKLIGPLYEKLKEQIEVRENITIELRQALYFATEEFSVRPFIAESDLRRQALKDKFGVTEFGDANILNLSMNQIKEFFSQLESTKEFQTKKAEVMRKAKEMVEAELVNRLRKIVESLK